MMYDERFIGPMRAEIAQLGVAELKSAQAVDDALKGTKGTQLMVVNSMCGCAARNMRPAVAMALKHSVTPNHKFTVFAGNDVDATRQARAYFTGYAPSSPSIALLKDGKLVHMIERWQIEGRAAEEIAQDLTAAFDKHCAPAAV
ncbi:BrxA/BrxB family bacilliredoxin [Pseudogemmatithrix spongiicola]|uniref:BrxA/BrxB family bacilliredoxin n=2 Tax=Pseudogemmatithrix spongiicola TaxID=3062599 RepID=A0AA49Q655_9BACT|nr:BrxA/BrxB family bacilliredoxin [Gemmatimonadaceae bacterium 'strain 138']WKW16373.1 BrxA/BrxB family bacilliredoxin [Gemmatimonadaceae bacterium 'strain 318']